MSYAAATQRFARQAARARLAQHRTEIQPLTAAAAVDGLPLMAALTPPKGVQELTDNGVSIVVKAQLRVLKGLSWTPAERSQFRVVATNEIFRCRTAVGASSSAASEIVCEVVRISP